MRVKFGESGWKRHYAVLHEDTIALYAEKYDVNPVMESTLTGNIVAPGETYTRKKYAFCVRGAHTHLLFRKALNFVFYSKIKHQSGQCSLFWKIKLKRYYKVAKTKTICSAG